MSEHNERYTVLGFFGLLILIAFMAYLAYLKWLNSSKTVSSKEITEAEKIV